MFWLYFFLLKFEYIYRKKRLSSFKKLIPYDTDFVFVSCERDIEAKTEKNRKIILKKSFYK